MIYTVTLNPSLDYCMYTDIILGDVNRSQKEHIYAGGKGLNVSAVLHNLGLESTALGFIAGFTGDQIENLVKESVYKTDFIRLHSGLSRINVKLKSDIETEINGQGPPISEDEVGELLQKLNSINCGDTLVLAGSGHKSLGTEIYKKIISYVNSLGRDIPIIVDATGELLTNTLPLNPFLVKPNKSELEEIFQIKLNSNEEIINKAKLLIEMGARNVIVSLAENGAILVTEDFAIHTNAPKGRAINSTGAGDSLVAGFIYEYSRSQDIKQAFLFGITSGSAGAFSEKLPTKSEIMDIYNSMSSDF